MITTVLAGGVGAARFLEGLVRDGYTDHMTTRDVIEEFEILMEPDEDGFHVWCPALKGCHSWGATRDEARSHIKEAIELWLETTGGATGQHIPDRERVKVRLP